MRTYRSVLAALVILCMTGALGLHTPTPAASAGSGRTTLISIAANGSLPTGLPATYAGGWSSGWPTIAADGNVIAFSTNLNLSPSDTNGITDVYLYDRSDPASPGFIVASRGSDGKAAGVDGTAPFIESSLSADGKVVVFATASAKLDQNDQNGRYDVYAFHVDYGLVRVSRGLNGALPDNNSVHPDVSGDGGRVVYSSSATNLVAGDTNQGADVFIADISWGATPAVNNTWRVSQDIDGSQYPGNSTLPSINRLGSAVAYSARPGDASAPWDIYATRLDAVGVNTERAFVTFRVTAGDGDSLMADITGEGDRVVFKSGATNLAPGDTNGSWDIFTAVLGYAPERVSLNYLGQQANGHSGEGPSAYSGPRFSANGRYVVFTSAASDLVEGDGNGTTDVFVRDLSAGVTSLLSLGSDGGQAYSPSGGMAGVSDDGGVGVFASTASNLSAMDVVTQNDIFLRVAGATNAPPSATIELISPLTAPVNDQGYLYLRGGGSTPEGYIKAYAWVSSKDGVLSQSEDASVPLSQLSVGSHSISLRVLDSRGMAAASPSRSVSILPPADQVETLIVENVPQLGRLYPGDKTVANVRPLLLELAMKTKGVVISLDNDPTARAAYTAWNAAGGNTTAGANAVAAAARGLINQQRALYPGLRYLVLVGDDRVIPHYRMPDPTQYEIEYAPSVDPNPGAASTIGRALYDNQLLTDDYYASGDAIGPIFVPTLAVGRLVETPFQILDQLWRFNQGGAQAIGSALASGWALAPGWSEQLCGTLGNDGLNTDCSLIGSFSNADFVGKALNTRHDLILITGHAAHYIHGLPDGTGINATSISNGTADLAGSLIYDGACHTGLNVSPAANQPNDLTQSFISRSGPYIGNTGYAPYSPQVPAYSDELMLTFAREVVAGGATSVGEALLRAKGAYIRDSAYALDAADVKALAEATLYGLPMFAYTTPAAATAQVASDPVDAQSTLSDLGGGLTMNQASYQFPPLELVKTPDGSYYTLGGMSAVADGKPVQPKYVADMSFPSTSAHGVVFRGGRYQDITPFDPVVAEALNRGEVRPEPALTATGWVPSLMSRLNHLDRLDAMATLLGQYNPTTGTERLYSQLSLSVYYHQTSSDRQAPAIGAISASDGGGQVRLSVRAGDSSGIVAVVVAYTAGDGVWASAELAEQTGVWNGSFPAGPSTRYFVQVVDGAGNVTALDNDGRYFGVGALAPGGGPTYLPLVRR